MLMRLPGSFVVQYLKVKFPKIRPNRSTLIIILLDIVTFECRFLLGLLRVFVAFDPKAELFKNPPPKATGNCKVCRDSVRVCGAVFYALLNFASGDNRRVR